MCLNPITIKNPAFTQGSPFFTRRIDKKTGKVSYIRRPGTLASASISDSAFSSMTVPCGTCSECMAKTQLLVLQRCLEQSRGKHVIFCTNTYRNSALRYIQCGERMLPVVDWDDFDTLIRLARKHQVLPHFSYLAVSEYGGKRHRPHFHYLLFIDKSPQDDSMTIHNYAKAWTNHIFKYWARNIGSRKHPVWEPNSLFIRKLIHGKIQSTYDVSPVLSNDFRSRLVPDEFKDDDLNVSFYVTKYVLKFDEYVKRTQQWMRLNLPPEEYAVKWPLFRPSIHNSKGFGLSSGTESYIRYCIKRSLVAPDADAPKYYLPDGRAVPLSRFYRSSSKHCFLEGVTALQFSRKSKDLVDGTNSHYSEPKTLDDELKAKERYNNRKELFNARHEDFLDEFE